MNLSISLAPFFSPSDLNSGSAKSYRWISNWQLQFHWIRPPSSRVNFRRECSPQNAFSTGSNLFVRNVNCSFFLFFFFFTSVNLLDAQALVLSPERKFYNHARASCVARYQMRHSLTVCSISQWKTLTAENSDPFLLRSLQLKWKFTSMWTALI